MGLVLPQRELTLHSIPPQQVSLVRSLGPRGYDQNQLWMSCFHGCQQRMPGTSAGGNDSSVNPQGLKLPEQLNSKGNSL